MTNGWFRQGSCLFGNLAVGPGRHPGHATERTIYHSKGTTKARVMVKELERELGNSWRGGTIIALRGTFPIGNSGSRIGSARRARIGTYYMAFERYESGEYDGENRRAIAVELGVRRGNHCAAAHRPDWEFRVSDPAQHAGHVSGRNIWRSKATDQASTAMKQVER